MRLVPRGTSRVAFASTCYRTSRTRTSTTSTKSTATQPHWRRIGRRPTTPSGVQQPTPSTGHLRRRAARPCFRLRPTTGRETSKLNPVVAPESHQETEKKPEPTPEADPHLSGDGQDVLSSVNYLCDLRGGMRHCSVGVDGP